jgi:acyl carrier protein
MVLDDGLISQLDAARMERVFAPKALGAWHLHEAAANAPLDFFVMFSSMASVLGSTGQANYVAANTVLDQLAAHRRARGLPALAINWGALGGAGAVNSNEDMVRYLESMGVQTATLDESLTALGVLLRKEIGQAVFAKIDWRQLARTNAQAAEATRLSELTSGSGIGGGGRIRQELLALPVDQRAALLARFVADQVAKVLKTDRSKIELDLPLNELGLDSLSSFQLKNRIEGELGVSLSAGKFLQKPTVAGLSEAILENLAAEGEAAETTESAEILDTKTKAPVLSYRQEWLWHQIKAAPTRNAYLRDYEMAHVLRVRPRPDSNAMLKIARETVAAHPILSCSFPEVDGRPSICSGTPDDVPIRITDTSGMDETAFLAFVQGRVDAPMDVEKGPLFEIEFLPRPDDELVILLRTHHIISDGTSNARLIQETFARYFGLGTDLGNGEEPATYIDFARWQRRMIAGKTGRRHREFWAKQLADVGPLLELPFDRSDRSELRQHGHYIDFTVGDPAGRDLESFARKRGTTSYVVLLAAFNTLIHELSGRRDFPVSAAVAGRTRREFETTLGWFANEIVFRGPLDPAETIGRYIDRLDGVVRDALEHQDYPFNLCLETEKQAIAERRSALDQVGFYVWMPGRIDDPNLGALLLKMPGARYRIPGMEVEAVPFVNDDCRRDLTVYTQVVDDAILGSFNYDAHLFDEATVAGFIERYRDILGTVITRPDLPIRSLKAAAKRKPAKMGASGGN